MKLSLKSILKENEMIDHLVSSLQKEYPVQLHPKFKLASFLKEWVPSVIYAYMITSKAVKVCSGISPAFAIFANHNGFPTFIAHGPGHVFNVILTQDGPIAIDLSVIQFEFCLANEDEKAEVWRLLKIVSRNPFAAIKIYSLIPLNP